MTDAEKALDALNKLTNPHIFLVQIQKKELAETISKALQRAEKMRLALEFYADESTYDPNSVLYREDLRLNRATVDINLVPPVKIDQGKKARDVLEELR